MSQQTFLSPDRLYDRPWRAGAHPFGRQLSAKRRWLMLALFFLLCSIIGGDLFVTDSRRVQMLAEQELSKLIGANVKVRSAKLSLFEGLKLEYVNVWLDDEARHDDSLLFEAKTF